MCPVELIGINLCLFQEHPLLISKNKRIDKRLGNAKIHQKSSLLWRHNGREGVSNHQPHECLLNRSFMRRSKKTSKLRVTGLCAGNSPESPTGQESHGMSGGHNPTTESFLIFGKEIVLGWEGKAITATTLQLVTERWSPWLPFLLIKNKLYRKLITIGSSYYECQYKMYRNKLNSLLKCAEKQYIADLLESNKSNLKKTWNIMKHIVNRKKTQKLQEKFKMSDNTITSDKTVIAENFNDFFVNIGNNLAKRIPNVSTPPGRYMGDMISQSLFLDPATPQEIAEIIKSLKNGAPGYDEINIKILQLSVTPIIGPLSFLCNRSLTEGVFPSELKLANVLPLFKSGESMLFNNYRPVSLLCTLSKVFEKIMYSRLLNFLDYHKILIGNQFGFRKLHSSYMALMLMMDQVTKALDSGECVIGIFFRLLKGVWYRKP